MWFHDPDWAGQTPYMLHETSHTTKGVDAKSCMGRIVETLHHESREPSQLLYILQKIYHNTNRLMESHVLAALSSLYITSHESHKQRYMYLIFLVHTICWYVEL